MITDEKSIHKLPHNIIMEDRKKLSVSGVTDIDSFDEQTIIAITDLGELTIRGWNLHITRLNLEQSELMVDGEISSLTYTDVRPKAQGFFSKVLR
jgi:sporulation protein YabP